MNKAHAEVCGSEEWAGYIRDDVIPRVVGDLVLGARVLELGPGYGAATRWLLGVVDELVTVEPDEDLADGIEARFPGTQVVRCSGSDVPFDDATFDAVVCFTMLHHVPTSEEQDAIFAEAARVLRPGGRFAGSDSLGRPELAEFHEDDIYNPVDPSTLQQRLEMAGFEEVHVLVTQAERSLLSFSATRP